MTTQALEAPRLVAAALHIVRPFRQSSAIRRMMPIGMIGHCVNVGIAVTGLWGVAETRPLVVWALASWTAGAFFLYLSYKPHRAPEKSVSRRKLPRKTMLSGGLLSLPWGVLGWWLLGSLPQQQEQLVIALCIGMAASGSVMLSTVYQAAVVYVLVTLLPLMIRCFTFPGPKYYLFGGLVVCYLFFLFNCIASCYRLFTDRRKAVEDLKQSLVEVQSAKAALEHVAMRDPLTALPNRRQLYVDLLVAVTRSKLNHRKGAALFIDLDRFKTVNDSLGHGAGDELLLLVAQRLREDIGESDVLARLGGDEFVLVLAEVTSTAEACGVANRLIHRLGQPFHLSAGHEVYVGASVGVSVFPDHDTDPQRIIQQADTALYQAKRSGGGLTCFYTPQLSLVANARLEIEAAIRNAYDRDEFVLHYQPSVRLSDNAPLGVECLIRWNDPARGFRGPDTFISVAEDTGFIVTLGDWVLRQACSQMMEWRRAGCMVDRIAVNLSARQFRQPNIDRRIREILGEAGMPPSYLELELTETALMEGNAIGKLNGLKNAGISVAVDDFGTGYSSLAYLRRFEIDKLKIDKSFVSDIPNETAANGIAAAIITLGKTLNLQVVAEGVENEAQLTFLRQHRCDAAQGFLFSKPLRATDVPLWFASARTPQRALAAAACL